MLAAYFHLLFALGLGCCLALQQPESSVYRNRTLYAVALWLLAALLIGLLPVPWEELESDRTVYAAGFVWLSALHELPNIDNDPLFACYVWLCSRLMSCELWFVLTALIYVGNHLFFSFKLGKQHGLILFLMFCYGFQFYAYGTNTLRAGLAASVLLAAFAKRDNILPFLGLILVSINIHFSMALPALAMVATRYYNRPRVYLAVWLAALVLSAGFGHYFENLLSPLIPDDRSSYLMTAAGDTHYKVGFRLDFLLYSMAPIVMGWYCIARKGFTDPTYYSLFNTYLLSNSFWILVIRANFSDRFAYLSWFLYPAILVYPLFTSDCFRRRRSVLSLVVFLYLSFTYFRFVVSG